MPRSPLFSQRHGHSPLNKELQLESMDDALRKRLWTGYVGLIWTEENGNNNYMRTLETRLAGLLWFYWTEFFKEPIDRMPHDAAGFLQILRNYFFKCKWHDVYDFIEFTLEFAERIDPSRHTTLDRMIKDFTAYSNRVMEEESSGYRIIGNHVVPITNDIEIENIDEAIENAGPFPGVTAHLRTATKLLSDRDHPDYRNSIKESISAVEAICNAVTGKQHSGISPALDALEKKIKINLRLKQGFEKIYAYTSSADGIRHSLPDYESTATFTDAKFMLVICSAFVNYVIGKLAEKNGSS